MKKIQIIHDDIKNIEKYLDPNSVDMVLTDPPYPREYLPVWSTLAETSAKILKPGKILLTYSNHANLPYVLLRMMPYLKYVWTFAMDQPGSHSSYFPAHVWPNWKPILLFAKPPYKPTHNWIRDPIKGGGREKSLHPWQQSLPEAEELIKWFTNKGDLVVDPFLGSGTIGAAAKLWERNFFGMDIDKDAVDIAERRVQRIQPQMTLQDSFIDIQEDSE